MHLFLIPLLASLQDPADPVKTRLESSPRHHEWVDVERGERTLRCFVAYPESKDKVAAVLVIHENKGLTDWVRGVADQLAEAGYLAIAPDLLSGAGPKGGNTDGFESVDAATQALYKLDPAQVSADLNAVADAALKIPSCNGKLFVSGFCWGGSQTFDFATRRKGLQGAFVFYGSAPKDENALSTIECPVYGFYGEDDARITAGVPATAESMKKAGKTYDPVVYDGAGHGFLRSGEAADASEANRKAREQAWARWKELLGASGAK
ncbi:MAG: dienelactone hydrolase family protein [Planctomycetota bacterium]|nr:MAG: dienelactone hydrolase family protein [Planctomycetota bacterium]